MNAVKPTWPPSLLGRNVRQSHPEFVAKMEALAMQNQTRPLDKNSAVTLREVSPDNLRAVCWLDVAPSQDGLVAPNAFSIAQAHFHQEAWFRAVYADETPVGFVMLEDPQQVTSGAPKLHHGESYIALWRFMIDTRYQKYGYGAQAIKLLLTHAKSRGAKIMLLSFVPKENNPELFYARMGFARNGEMDDDEVVMTQRLDGK